MTYSAGCFRHKISGELITTVGRSVTAGPSMIYCQYFSVLSLQQSYTSNEDRDSAYRGVWFHEIEAQVTEPYVSCDVTLAYDVCVCVCFSSFSRHISQVGLSVSPSLQRCPFSLQCPVSSPTSHRNWFLF